jgi:hypothetical protein
MLFKYEVWEDDYLLFRFYDRDNAVQFMTCRPNTKLIKVKPPTIQDLMDKVGEAIF